MLYQLVNIGFQVLFHSPPGVLFTFPSQYYTLSVTEEYLGLGGGPPGFKAGFTCPLLLWILPCLNPFRLQDYYLLWCVFPYTSAKVFESRMQSATPKVLLPSVWPLSLSLAATKKIDVSFSSSAYLDVSVQRVTSMQLWIHCTVLRYCLSGFPHSEICGSMDICS